MRILTGLAFFGNIALWIIIGIAGFGAAPAIGLGILAGLIGFFIAWNISGGMVTSPADYFFQPEWDVFMTKLKWSNSTAIGIAIVAAIIISGFMGTA